MHLTLSKKNLTFFNGCFAFATCDLASNYILEVIILLFEIED